MPIKSNILKFLVLLVASVFSCQNCATIISGTSKEIPVTSNPVGARITGDGEELGYTPLILKLKKKNDHIIRVDKPGYNPLEIRINRKISGSLAISIIGNGGTLGPIGAILGLFVGSALIEENRTKDMTLGELLGEISLSFLIGSVIGTAVGVFGDLSSGAIYTLSPADLILTLTKIEGIPQPDIIVMDSGQFQNIRWIRIKLPDSGREEEILNKDFLD
jgi:PEGA domain